MTTPTLETKVHDFLAQKAHRGGGRGAQPQPPPGRQSDRSAVEEDRARRLPIPGEVDGVVIITRPEVTERIVHDCAEAKVRRVWMRQSLGEGSSVSRKPVEYCRQHDISVIASACPMMFGPGADFGHTCMRWFLKLTDGLPA